MQQLTRHESADNWSCMFRAHPRCLGAFNSSARPGEVLLLTAIPHPRARRHPRKLLVNSKTPSQRSRKKLVSSGRAWAKACEIWCFMRMAKWDGLDLPALFDPPPAAPVDASTAAHDGDPGPPYFEENKRRLSRAAAISRQIPRRVLPSGLVHAKGGAPLEACSTTCRFPLPRWPQRSPRTLLNRRKSALNIWKNLLCYFLLIPLYNRYYCRYRDNRMDSENSAI